MAKDKYVYVVISWTQRVEATYTDEEKLVRWLKEHFTGVKLRDVRVMQFPNNKPDQPGKHVHLDSLLKTYDV